MFCVLLCITLCQFWFCDHLDGEERAGCFTLFVFLVSRESCVALPHDAMGLSAVCDFGIACSYSLNSFAQGYNTVTQPEVRHELANIGSPVQSSTI